MDISVRLVMSSGISPSTLQRQTAVSLKRMRNNPNPRPLRPHPQNHRTPRQPQSRPTSLSPAQHGCNEEEERKMAPHRYCCYMSTDYLL
jgi:hypothetical protein